jgi:hypothetical protein
VSRVQIKLASIPPLQTTNEHKVILQSSTDKASISTRPSAKAIGTSSAGTENYWLA